MPIARSILLAFCLAILLAASVAQVIGLLGGVDWYWESGSQGFRRIQLESRRLVIAICDPAPNATPPFTHSTGNPVQRRTMEHPFGSSMVFSLIAISRNKSNKWVFDSQYAVGSRDCTYDEILTEPLVNIDWRDVRKISLEMAGPTQVPFRLHILQIPYFFVILLAMIYPGIFLIRGWQRRRRRRRGMCVHCGYDLRGSVSGVCSECGAAIVGGDDDKKSPG